MSSPAPAPLSFVEMDLKTYMKLLFDGMVAEEIQPMRDQLSKLSQAVLGNGVPPLATQIVDAEKRRIEAERDIHTRISDLRKEVLGDPEQKKNTETRLMFKGAWYALGATGGVIAGLFEIVKLLR